MPIEWWTVPLWVHTNYAPLSSKGPWRPEGLAPLTWVSAGWQAEGPVSSLTRLQGIVTFCTWELRWGEVKKLSWSEQFIRRADIQTKVCWCRDCHSQNVGAQPFSITWEFLRSTHSRAPPGLRGVGPSILWSHEPPGVIMTHTTVKDHATVPWLLWDFSELYQLDYTVNQLFRGRLRTQNQALSPPCLYDDAREVIRRHGWPPILVALYIP